MHCHYGPPLADASGIALIRPRTLRVARFTSILAKAHPLTLHEMDAGPLPIKLRDGVARLLTPYL